MKRALFFSLPVTRKILMSVLILGGLTVGAQTASKKSSQREFEAFKLVESRILYRKPLLASGPAIGLPGALPVGTELLLVYGTRNREWVFVRREDGLEGWIPTAWVRASYPINLADVRLRYYPDPPELEAMFELSTDVEVWGDDLLLDALNSKKP